jgi:hypothetical protein
MNDNHSPSIDNSYRIIEKNSHIVDKPYQTTDKWSQIAENRFQLNYLPKFGP